MLPNTECPNIDAATGVCADGSKWDYTVGKCAEYLKDWDHLSPKQKEAAAKKFKSPKPDQLEGYSIGIQSANTTDAFVSKWVSVPE